LAEDEADLRFSLSHNLQFEGYRVLEAGDGCEALRLLKQQVIDLLILDIMMPRMDGLTALKELRRTCTLPVMLLTARASELDKVIGFELGADDYLTKPFSLGEFLARVKALLRRSNPVISEPEQLAFGPFRLDLVNYRLFRAGEEIRLSQKEFQLLRHLVLNAGRTLDKRSIQQAVWEVADGLGSRTLDTHIARLRRKLEDQNRKEWIQTVPTVGYRFAPLPDR